MQIIATKDYSLAADNERNGWHPAEGAHMTIGQALEGARNGSCFVAHMVIGLGSKPGGRIFGLCVIPRKVADRRRLAA